LNVVSICALYVFSVCAANGIQNNPYKDTAGKLWRADAKHVVKKQMKGNELHATCIDEHVKKYFFEV